MEASDGVALASRWPLTRRRNARVGSCPATTCGNPPSFPAPDRPPPTTALPANHASPTTTVSVTTARTVGRRGDAMISRGDREPAQHGHRDDPVEPVDLAEGEARDGDQHEARRPAGAEEVDRRRGYQQHERIPGRFGPEREQLQRERSTRGHHDDGHGGRQPIRSELTGEQVAGQREGQNRDDHHDARRREVRRIAGRHREHGRGRREPRVVVQEGQSQRPLPRPGGNPSRVDGLLGQPPVVPGGRAEQRVAARRDELDDRERAHDGCHQPGRDRRQRVRDLHASHDLGREATQRHDRPHAEGDRHQPDHGCRQPAEEHHDLRARVPEAQAAGEAEQRDSRGAGVGARRSAKTPITSPGRTSHAMSAPAPRRYGITTRVISGRVRAERSA